MTTTSLVATPPASPASPASPGTKPVYRVSWGGVLRSEWAKLWSLRSTWICLVTVLVATLAVGITGALQYRATVGAGGQPSADFAGMDAVGLSLFGVSFAQLVVGVLGVLMSAGEHATGSILSTFTAVPRRVPVLFAKAVVCLAVTFVVGLVTAFGSFVIVSAIVRHTGIAMTLTAPGVVRALAGSALYLALSAVISLGLGSLLRSVAGGIAALVAIVFIVPGLLSLLPTGVANTISPYLPSTAGGSMYALHQASGTLSPGAGMLVLLAWTVIAIVAATWRLMRSDI